MNSACMKIRASDQRGVDLGQARFVVGGLARPMRLGAAKANTEPSATNRHIRVKSVGPGDRPPPLDFRFTPLATEIARRRNMSRWATSGLMPQTSRATRSIMTASAISSSNRSGANRRAEETGLLMNALAIVVSATLLAWPIAATA